MDTGNRDEHILVCLSSSPSNARIIRTAAGMAEAFKGEFTALYVETPDSSPAEEEDVRRLQSNMHLARRLGAKIETAWGDDVPFQIREFARLSGVTRIVIGRSQASGRGVFRKPALTERLLEMDPDVDVHIIPDAVNGNPPYHRKRKNLLMLSAAEVLKSAAILIIASLIGFVFRNLGFADANIIMVYVLGVLLIAVLTTSRFYSLLASVVSVFAFNFLFTEPAFTLLAYDQGYPITFLIMFLAAFLTGSLAARLKDHARQAARSAFRTKILFDTNQMLQQSGKKEEIMTVTAGQLIKLLGKDVVFYLVEDGALQEPRVFRAEEGEGDESYTSEEEQEAARWTAKHNKHSGASTGTFPEARCLYLAVRVCDRVYGVVGLVIGSQPPDAFENSILLSILGECALVLENEKIEKEREAAALLAQKEQLRADLLRAISHDLRTPLTSISGNASNLLTNGSSFDEVTKRQLYTDIYDDSMWLAGLVENLLSITRLEEGGLNLHITEDLMDDVIEEALNHVNRRSAEHQIRVERQEEFLLARMDARLIVQVLINLVDNAIKYTEEGSQIVIRTRKEGDKAVVSVADNGDGIPDERKERIFDMFYCGAHRITDSRRSLGLGLALCRSIVNAHGGEITVGDQVPKGTVFTFTLPAGEVQLHE